MLRTAGLRRDDKCADSAAAAHPGAACGQFHGDAGFQLFLYRFSDPCGPRSRVDGNRYRDLFCRAQPVDGDRPGTATGPAFKDGAGRHACHGRWPGACRGIRPAFVGADLACLPRCVADRARQWPYVADLHRRPVEKGRRSASGRSAGICQQPRCGSEHCRPDRRRIALYLGRSVGLRVCRPSSSPRPH